MESFHWKGRTKGPFRFDHLDQFDFFVCLKFSITNDFKKTSKSFDADTKVTSEFKCQSVATYSKVPAVVHQDYEVHIVINGGRYAAIIVEKLV